MQNEMSTMSQQKDWDEDDGMIQEVCSIDIWNVQYTYTLSQLAAQNNHASWIGYAVKLDSPSV